MVAEISDESRPKVPTNGSRKFRRMVAESSNERQSKVPRNIPKTNSACIYTFIIQAGKWTTIFLGKVVFACVPRRPMNCQGSCSSCCSARDKVEKHYEGGLWEQKCTNNFCSLTPQMGDRITSDPTSEAIGGRWRSLNM